MDSLFPPMMMAQMASGSSSQPVVQPQNPHTPPRYQEVFATARQHLQQRANPNPLSPRTPLAAIASPGSPIKDRSDKEQDTPHNGPNTDKITSFPIRFKPFPSDMTTETMEWIVTEKMLRQMGAGSADMERMAVDGSYEGHIVGYQAMANRFLATFARVGQQELVAATTQGTNSYLRLVNQHLKRKTTYLNSKSMFVKGPDGQKRPMHQLMATLHTMTYAQLKILFLVASNYIATSSSSLTPFSMRMNERDIHLLTYSHQGKTSLMLWTGIHASGSVPPKYLLGRGGFSVAQQTVDFADGTCHALRVSRCDISSKRRALGFDDLQREKSLLRYLNETLGPVDGLPEAPSLFWLSVEQLQYGMLDSVFEGDLSKITFSSIQPASRKIQFLRQMAKIIDVVSTINHRTSVVHGDLKPANILFRILPNGEFQLRLTDFGHSRYYSDICHKRHPFPALYTEGYYIEAEYQAFRNIVGYFPVHAVASTLRQMEVYALGITLQKILRAYFDQTPKALHDYATMDALRDRAIAEGLNKSFYIDLKMLVTRMTFDNPAFRLPLDQAAPDLDAILDHALPSMLNPSGTQQDGSVEYPLIDNQKLRRESF